MTKLTSLLSGILLLSAITAHSQTVIAALPHTITKSGNYVIGADLAYAGKAHAITVKAPDVTIDLQGFTLSCNDDISPTIAVYVDNVSDVTIKNGVITGFRTGVDIDSPPAQNLQNVAEIVQDLQITAPQYGIVVVNPVICLIQRNVIVGGTSGAGVYLSQSIGGNRVSYNQVSGAQYGFQSDGNCYLLENCASSCLIGFFSSSSDKYRFCSTTLCNTPFSGGADAGAAND
jgi:Periplasmic copper-binding protein (NosD)